jgi:hypothetical protein
MDTRTSRGGKVTTHLCLVRKMRISDDTLAWYLNIPVFNANVVTNTENNKNFWEELIARRMSSSRMWRRVDLVWNKVSEELVASIFRVEKCASEKPAWAGGSVCCSYIAGCFRLVAQSASHQLNVGSHKIYGATSQKAAFFIVTAVKTSNPN